MNKEMKKISLRLKAVNAMGMIVLVLWGGLWLAMIYVAFFTPYG